MYSHVMYWFMCMVASKTFASYDNLFGLSPLMSSWFFSLAIQGLEASSVWNSAYKLRAESSMVYSFSARIMSLVYSIEDLLECNNIIRRFPAIMVIGFDVE